MVDDHGAQLVLLLGVESFELLEVVERPTVPGGTRSLEPCAHPGLRPLGETGEPEPERPVDAVDVKALDALVHDHVGTRPGPEALAEHEHLGTLLLGHAAEALLHTPQQLTELRTPNPDVLHLQERRPPPVLDADGGDIAPGHQLDALDEGLVDPPRSRRREEEQM